MQAGNIDAALLRHAMRFDAEAPDEPQWREFARPALDCGTLLPGEARRFRVVLRNRCLTAGPQHSSTSRLNASAFCGIGGGCRGCLGGV